MFACLNHKDSSTLPFIIENRQLMVGDWVDVRDGSGLWL
jgi:hypothetical protein